MSAALPPDVATADEPIPAPSRPVLRNEPDMRFVTPIEVMLAELAHVADDDVAFVTQFRAFAYQVGCTLLTHYDRDGDVGLSVGSPVDAQVRHRSRWMHFLLGRLNEVESRRELLLATLAAEGLCWDTRPTDAKGTTAAMRTFLAAGGRLLLDPRGRLEEGGDYEKLCAGAGRAYFEARRRWRSDRQIKRAVRLLGTRTENGWTVLEARA